jgi:hypothetical protein
VDVVIWAWRHDQEWNPPQSGQRQTSEDDLTWKPPRPKELADGEEVGDRGNGQWDKERRTCRGAPATGTND